MQKIAFLILAHADPEHFNKLISSLGYECDIYVHIDAKSKLSDFTNLVKKENVCFIKKRSSVSWGGISMVDVQIKLIEEAINSNQKYSHCIFLSGADYLIKRIGALQEFLHANSEKEFIKFIDMRESRDHYMKHINKKWFKEPFIRSNLSLVKFLDKSIRYILNRMPLTIKNKWDNNMVPYFGSNWFALTTDACRYVVDFHKNNPWFYEMNKYSSSPDEHYIHTIIGNSFYTKNATGLQPFTGRGTYKMANLHIVDPSLAKWYTEEDWNEIVSSDKFFVRKVRSKDGALLVERINQEILKKPV